MEEKITIQLIETKQTKAGAPMWTATTSAGKMSCFDKALSEQLFKLIGKNIVVETEMQGIFKNLKRIITDTEEVMPTAQTQTIGQNFNRFSVASMMIAYAKDLCVAGKIESKDLKTTAKWLLTLYEEMIA